MSSHPSTLTRSASPVGANLTLSEAIVALAPAANSIDANTRKRTFDLLRKEWSVFDERQYAEHVLALIASYNRMHIINLDEVLAWLALLRKAVGSDGQSQVAALLDRERETRTQEQCAIARLHEAFFRGLVIVSGLKKGAADRQHHPIPSTYFSQTRVLDWRRNEISTYESVVDQIRANRGRFRETRGIEIEFEVVLVDGHSFDQWIAGQKAPQEKVSFIGAETACKDWLVDMCAGSPNRRPKSKNALKRDAMKKFRGLSGAGFLRAWGEVTRTYPGWTKPGAPKKTSVA